MGMLNKMKPKRWFQLGFMGWLTLTAMPLGLISYVGTNAMEHSVDSKGRARDSGHKIRREAGDRGVRVGQREVREAEQGRKKGES